VEKPVSKFAFQMQPAALHRVTVPIPALLATVADKAGWTASLEAPLTLKVSNGDTADARTATAVGLCRLNQVDP
jgi:hypothetical protein